MHPRLASPTVLLILLCLAVCLANLAVLMLGPLLVELAHEFQTSIPLVGQLGAATAFTWGIIAPLAGPVSDTYGRRRMLLTGLMLMAVGILGSVLAWNYGALLAFRLLTGVGGAMVPPNSIAAIADVFPPTGRGKAMGWVRCLATWRLISCRPTICQPETPRAPWSWPGWALSWGASWVRGPRTIAAA
jgi:predicted MFS family arabinose efflux permease